MTVAAAGLRDVRRSRYIAGIFPAARTVTATRPNRRPDRRSRQAMLVRRAVPLAEVKALSDPDMLVEIEALAAQ
jgi:hypothetical protein